MKPIVPASSELFLLPNNIQTPSASSLTKQPTVKRFGPFLYLEMQAFDASGQPLTGKLGQELTVEQSREALRICLTRCLMALTNTVGDLAAVKRVVSVHSFINSTLEFNAQTEVLKGALDFLVSIFGESGKGVQTMTLVNNLPNDCAASLCMLVEATP